ncbi:hypothetical protein [Bacillus cereus]|uniref:hypothetical protein n=1 Tax=Bacillus cereus TaxID=1396 RepID=UPI00065BD16D|nr:hypothetical protein [Bacillus cereus]KMP96501.1 hypothetical protein TU67_24975 [Bacillus cereus]
MSYTQEVQEFARKTEGQFSLNFGDFDHSMSKLAKANGGEYTSREELRQKATEKAVNVAERGDIDMRPYTMQLNDGHFQAEISPKVKGLVFVLATLMEVKTGGNVVDRKYKPLNLKAIAEKIGKSERTIRPVIQEAVSVGMLTDHYKGNGSEKTYTISDEFYRIGSMGRKSPSYTRVIKSSVREVSKDLSFEDLGYLSELINFMHPKYHALFRNPHEPNTEALEILRPKDIENLLGMKKGKGNRFVNALISLDILERWETGNRATKQRVKILLASEEFFSKTTKIVDRKELKKTISKETAFSNKNYIK